MQIGLLGKANVGKSTFFSAATETAVASGNFPFTTIEPNVGVAYVQSDCACKHFDLKHDNELCINGTRLIPIKLIDVAGLVPGAHEGKGLGNKFLDDLRQADALIHVIDLSGGTNEKGESVEINSYDPAEDVKFLEDELDHWFSNILERNWANIDKKIRMQDMKIEEALLTVLSGLKISEEQIIEAINALSLDKTNVNDNLFELAKKLREISKPMIIAANKCDVLQEGNLWKEKYERLVKMFPNYKIIPVMAEYEWNLKKAAKAGIIQYIPGEKDFKILKEDDLNEGQKKGLELIRTHMTSLGTNGVQDCINAAVFDLLEMKALFPGGSKLEDKDGNVIPDCFLMPKSTTALDFAYRLHTDFGKNFIKAIDVKTKMMVGKDHVLKFGDIVEIVSGK